MLRIVMISIWICSSCLIWVFAVAAGVCGLVKLSQSQGQPVTDFIPQSLFGSVVIIDLFGAGSIIVICIVTALGLRGKLPGTKR
jgi:hypothetical protein